MDIDLRKYINIPYKHLGRDFNGVDCFGICYLILKEEKNVILPDVQHYSRFWYKSGGNHINISLSSFSSIYKVVTVPYKLYDILIFFSNNNLTIASHMGLYIGDNRFVHTYTDKPTMINKLEGHYLHKLYKVIRIKELGD